MQLITVGLFFRGNYLAARFPGNWVTTSLSVTCTSRDKHIATLQSCLGAGEEIVGECSGKFSRRIAGSPVFVSVSCREVGRCVECRKIRKISTF